MPDVFDYRVIKITPLIKQVSCILLKPKAQPLVYVAGQYIQVIHPNETLSPLSIACAPNADNQLEFHLYHPIENHKAQDLLRMAQEEKEWKLSGPFGSCTVESLMPDTPIIFLARGTGFAPVKAVMESLIQSDHCPSLHLYWSVSKRDEFYMMKFIEGWKEHGHRFTFTPVVTKEWSEREMTNPHLLPETVLRDYPDLSNYQVYASGPRSLIYAAFYAFQKHGLHQERFYSDVFGKVS